ncbi:MAG: hypothetical protein MCM46_02615 [Candidatus Manganitrophus sp. SB1]|nr:hypothetical protein [Candidatus Manganitrophus morganii]
MKKLWILVAIFFLTGCAGATGLQRTLEVSSGELLFLHDSEKVPDKQTETVKIASFVVDDILQPNTTVEKKSGYIVPLLFLNFWKFEYQSSLGYAQIKNDYKKFIQESFVQELERSGKFRQIEDQADLELDIEVKNVTMSAPIVKTGNFLFVVVAWGFGYNTLAGPVDVVTTANVALKKDGIELFSKEFHGNSRTNILSGTNIKIEDYTLAMIEGLSLAIKDLHENIVEEINKT